MSDIHLQVIALLLVFVVPAIVIWVVQRNRTQRMVVLSRTISALLEKGQPIPPELFGTEPESLRSDLRSGLVLVAIGAGLAVFLAMSGGNIGIGAIPALVGVAYVVAWFAGPKERR